MSQTYSDVDASWDPVGAAAWQERMSRWPAVRAYKQRTYELLDTGDLSVDIGCGPGVDVAALGSRRCLGVELSETMAAAAARRGAVVCRADAHRLPFCDGAFTGARADRVFQHLTDPLHALNELIRVVGSGGRVVIGDPDQDTLVIRVPGVRQSVLDRLTALRRDVGYRNGTLIAQMPQHLSRHGIHDITVERFPLTLTDPADAFGLPTWPAVWREQGGFTDEEIVEWDEALQGRPLAGFAFLVSFFVVAGIKN